ncbi:MAG: hypothetical protein HYY65_09795 [Candidatus Tectomicrobia bacterium]|uniref:SurA N-terminal domain-containing protein n=1 Tax=Tectimicrobiota bacterium TaxID=2528274 RepID=A0A932GQJ7_UNCTE|nr:hypothetical protein [Candidatus Tectomicrobia bacterium]
MKSGTGWLRHRWLESALAVVGLLWGLFTPASSAGAGLVMRVLAVVNDTVLTSKDLTDFMALQSLVPGPGSMRNTEPGESLAQLIDQVLILQEARRRQIVEITADEVDSEIRRRMALLGGAESREQRRKALGVSEEVIRELVRRQLLALKYMDLRLRLFIRVTAGEIEEYYKEQRGELGETPLEELKGRIEQLLAARKFNARLQEWTRELRDRARITIPSEDLKLVGGDEVPARELFPGPRGQSKEGGVGR